MITTYLNASALELPETFSQIDQGIIGMIMSVVGFGERTFWQLVKQLQLRQLGLSDFWQMSAKNQELFVYKKFVESIKNIKKEYENTDYFEWLAQQQVSAIIWGSENYPPLLKTISMPPPLLYARGQPSSTRNYLAVIGSRKMTAYGDAVIRSWVPELCRTGLIVVSGAVTGVDQTAQQVALDTHGQTVAVLGQGLLADTSYTQRQLLGRWADQGAWLLSSFAPHTQPSKGSFLARNRVVAGMSLGVLVIEAAEQSGTLHTAQWAADFGRSMMAVPGSVFNPFAVGTARLVNQGAALAVSSASVVDTLRHDWPDQLTSLSQVQRQIDNQSPNPTPEPTRSLLAMLHSSEWRYDELLARLQPQWSLAELLTAMSELEIAQLVVRQGEWVSLN